MTKKFNRKKGRKEEKTLDERKENNRERNVEK
jgi:hypothetical protein